MKYFFLAFFMVLLLVVIVAGPRGRHSPARPLEFLPDMVRQGKVKPQQPSVFFADGVASRHPVDGAVPMGYEIPRTTAASEIATVSKGEAPGEQPRLRYTEAPDYYDTGRMDDQWGTGIPLEVTAQILERGRERFTINCQVCHGATGSGNGVTSKYGLSNIANYHDAKYLKMADGEIFNTISNGHNTMIGYGANITVRDRWAIICYIRALQRSQTVKLGELPLAERDAVAAAK